MLDSLLLNDDAVETLSLLKNLYQ